MKTSSAGIAAIREREGCRLTAYRDTRGIPTIGVGHVDATPPVTQMGMTITQARADELLAADLAPFEAAVNSVACATPLTQNQFDACVSLAFNIGAAGFKRSSVARRITAGDIPGAAGDFLLWDKPAVLKGRREAERLQFLGTNAPAPSKPIHKGKAAASAVVVAAGAGAALVPHGSYWMGALVAVAMIAAAVFLAIHFKK